MSLYCRLDVFDYMMLNNFLQYRCGFRPSKTLGSQYDIQPFLQKSILIVDLLFQFIFSSVLIGYIHFHVTEN